MNIQTANNTGLKQEVRIPIESAVHLGTLCIPEQATGLVLFAHGSGSSRLSPRNAFVAQVLNQNRIGTLLFDLLTEAEDSIYENRFNIDLLSQRLLAATMWSGRQPWGNNIHYGYFGASTGAAAGLKAAAPPQTRIRAIVSRGGRPDMAGPALSQVQAPTLLIVGGYDDIVIELNKEAYDKLSTTRELKIIPGATHLFEEPGTLEQVADLAAAWFSQYL